MIRFQTVQSKVIYRGRAFNVRKDEVRLPNGGTTNLDIVEHVDAVTILPLDDEGQIWLVRQYRHPAGIEILELPAGILDEVESPLSCAHREIQEEIGMGARRLEKIGEYFLAPGYSTEYMHVYLAMDLFPSVLPHDEDEFLSVVRYPLPRIFDAVRSGEIQDAKTLASLYLAQPFLKTSGRVLPPHGILRI
jgi:ADP-ribose pyrophosphatase